MGKKIVTKNVLLTGQQKLLFDIRFRATMKSKEEVRKIQASPWEKLPSRKSCLCLGQVCCSTGLGRKAPVLSKAETN